MQSILAILDDFNVINPQTLSVYLSQKDKNQIYLLETNRNQYGKILFNLRAQPLLRSGVRDCHWWKILFDDKGKREYFRAEVSNQDYYFGVSVTHTYLNRKTEGICFYCINIPE